MRCFGINRIIGDVALLFQNPDDVSFDPRVRNKHVGLLRLRSIADAREEIGDWVSNSAHEIL